MSACLIFLNGELGDAALARRASRGVRAVLCSDGGLRHARTLGLTADVVIGDMDSLPRPLPKKAARAYSCDFDEATSDFEKALRFALDAGFRTAFVAAALGGRVDHALVNLALIEKYAGALELVVLDRGAARLLGPGKYARFARAGETFSVLAAPKARVTLAGVKYRLKSFSLSAGSRGLSNVAAARPALTVHSGRVWLIAAR